MRVLPVFLTVLFAPFLVANEASKFPVGLDSKFEPFFASIPTPEVFDPNRKLPSVLLIQESVSDIEPVDNFLVSTIQFPADAVFPLKGKAYTSPETYLWRWILAFGPDIVVTDNTSLRKALTPQIPSIANLDELSGEIDASPVRLDLQKRSKRSPLQVAEAVGIHYGNQLKSPVYQPALAMIGRKRLAELKGENVSIELVAIAEKATSQKIGTPSHFSGHLIFAELEMKAPVLRAAKQAVDNPMDRKMSDSVFMVCPLLVEAGKLSADAVFYRKALEHFKRMQLLCLREDALYRHSPLDEAAWGRGNGFPALGVAWVLSTLPKDSNEYVPFVEAFKNHIAALVQFQDESGMWHQVIDQPGSYREFTSTCMITFAILRGIREGWLEQATYEPIARKGWEAIKLRISLDGKSFTDACTGTGKQKSLEDYFLRTAILGPDDRSGGMALLVATEFAALEIENGNQ